MKPIHPYLDNAGREDVIDGGTKMIPIKTEKGTFNVWTKRTGNNPAVKVLLLHGGPGMSCEYLEAFDTIFPGAGVEYYHYDQLGSYRSDQPSEPSLWEINRFVDEVEQVRTALGLTKNNFFLYGSSWGGLLAIEYALKYQQNLKGLIISNMMSNSRAYNEYANNVLMPQMDQTVLAKIKDFEARNDTDNAEYEELLMEHHYVLHVLRAPSDQWPNCVLRGMSRVNKDIYVPLQGPSELGMSGKLLDWDRTEDLAKINIPSLVISAHYDTMDPAYMEKMSKILPKGELLYCPNGSHLAMYDDRATYAEGILSFLAKHQ
jgi:proline iminopeptidase